MSLGKRVRELGGLAGFEKSFRKANYPVGGICAQQAQDVKTDGAGTLEKSSWRLKRIRRNIGGNKKESKKCHYVASIIESKK